MLTNKEASQRDNEYENVTSHRIIVSSISFGKEVNQRVQLVLAQCLNG